MKMVYICRNYAKNKNVLLFMRHTVYFRWQWHDDDDDDDDHNNNNNNSSEDIVFITVSIIVFITRFTALSL